MTQRSGVSPNDVEDLGVANYPKQERVLTQGSDDDASESRRHFEVNGAQYSSQRVGGIRDFKLDLSKIPGLIVENNEPAKNDGTKTGTFRSLNNE